MHITSDERIVNNILRTCQKEKRRYLKVVAYDNRKMLHKRTTTIVENINYKQWTPFNVYFR